MRSSQGVEEWPAEGRLEAYRDSLRVQLEDRFGHLPESLVQRLQAMTDVERLKAALRQGLHIQSLNELQL